MTATFSRVFFLNPGTKESSDILALMELTAHREETDAKQVIKQICSMSDGDRHMQKNNNMRINVRGGELECWKKNFF